MLHIFATAISPLFDFADSTLEKSVGNLTFIVLASGVVTFIALVVFASFTHAHRPDLKPLVFTLITVVTLGTTLTMVGGMAYLMSRSPAHGVVERQASIAFWACGNELALRTPQSLTNHLGSPSAYALADGSIHISGIPMSLPYDASLSKIMSSIGGTISDNSLVLPLNDTNYFTDNANVDGTGPSAPEPGLLKDNIVPAKDGMYAQFTNGQACGDQPAYVQTFVDQFDPATQMYKQTKLMAPEDYALSQQNAGQLGDCIIVEFAPDEAHTDRLCRTYGIRDSNYCGQFGIPAQLRRTCTIKEQP